MSMRTCTKTYVLLWRVTKISSRRSMRLVSPCYYLHCPNHRYIATRLYNHHICTFTVHAHYSKQICSQLYFGDSSTKHSKQKTGEAWSGNLIRWCLYLRHLSSGAYEMLRSSPSQRTLRDYMYYTKAVIYLSHAMYKLHIHVHVYFPNR